MRWMLALAFVGGCGDSGPVIGPEQVFGADGAAPDASSGADAASSLCGAYCVAPNVCWQDHAFVPDSGIGDLYGRCTTNCDQDPTYASQCAALGGVCRHPVLLDGGADLQGGICEKP